ncbi:hypothetical protein [Dictyobacter kobayashii]|uniref:hypothetical protein n=1 Tax=Dictyobacter kobayashii TaxID=2014872 RepID=UPI000F83A63D|nr:hypothetical protein [Dictyobacter kobayashii]
MPVQDSGTIIGIALLTISNFPIEEDNYLAWLCDRVSKASERNEVGFWVKFLSNISKIEPDNTCWQPFLVSILSNSKLYSGSILNAAMENYATLKADGKFINSDIDRLLE